MGRVFTCRPTKTIIAGWTTHHWLQFLEQLPDDVGTARMAELDQRFQLTQTGNSEILFDWLRLSILNRYTVAYPVLEQFLTSVGRLKFLIPLYKAMQDTPDDRDRAARIYATARSGYHSLAWKTLDPIIGYEQGGSD